MKVNLQSLLLLLVVSLVSCQSEVTQMVTYQINEPIVMSKTEFRAAVKIKTTAEPISTPGKMSFYKDHIFISEPEKGIHIINNSDPSNPVNVGYIQLIGNADLAIRNDILYADSYVDLVWFDISNPASPVEKGRLNDVFPEALPVMDNFYGYDYEVVEQKKSDNVIIGWQVKEKTVEITSYNSGWYKGGDLLEVYTSTGNSTGNTTGINGSMSRFAIYENKMYVVLNNYLTIVDVASAQPVKQSESIYVGRSVETIFSYKTSLFLGTPTGMMIYSVSDPNNPAFESMISHAYGCDPVVVDNDLAYVTVRSGNTCGQQNNELFIVDVKDTKNPKHIVTFEMTNPKGLGIDAGKLFLCDDGLKVFSIQDKPTKLIDSQILHEKGMDGFDLIPYNNTLMMIANEGLYQYNYSDINNIRFLSKISFTK